MNNSKTVTAAATPRPHSHYNSHRTYGGEIYPSDFDTENSGGPRGRAGSFIASRIASDSRFDEQCLRNDETRQRKK